MKLKNIIERKFAQETWAELCHKRFGLFSTTDKIKSNYLLVFKQEFILLRRWSYVETGKPLSPKLNYEVNKLYENYKLQG